ncbi:MAG: division/cell wall cluster transcriptional repressor MraZ [bacterium]|nr:division/cell wall cluster transcriptional repressor MraZ [bacterium]
MILGQYEGKLDEKSRSSFPKRFRGVFGEKLIITKGLDRNLIIVSVANWESLLEGTEELSFLNKDAREMQRFLLGNAAFVELDDKGRFLLPGYLREYAGLSDALIFAGMKRLVEVWDKTLWEKEQLRLSEKVPSIAERLSEGGKSDE